MKGSTRCARHLAESAVWLAWYSSKYSLAFCAVGTLMESALAHWSGAQLDAFTEWYLDLPQQRRAA